jgi:hypothetical protein
MRVRMVESKIDAEGVADVEAAVEKLRLALDAAQPEGIRYASFFLPDGETFVKLVQVEDGLDNPLQDLEEYQELLEVVEDSRAHPPSVQSWSIVGSYRLF